MQRLFERIRAEFPDDGYDDAYFKANVIYVTDHATGEEVPVSYGYVWVSDTRIYNMMAGLNVDGTPRVEEIPDPSWVPPPSEKEVEETADELADMLIAAADEDEAPAVASKKYTTVDLTADGKLIVPSADELEDFGFGDAMWETDVDRAKADYDQIQQAERAKKFIRPMIQRKLPPLEIGILPGYAYTPEQSQAHYKIQKEEAPAKGIDPEAIELPKYGFFIAESAYVRFPDEGYSKTEIFCSDAPVWITEKMIEEVFKRFNTDDSVYYGEVESFRREFTYPRVKLEETINKKTNQKIKRVTVSFSPNSPHDAAFALQMCRKAEFKNPLEPSKIARLIFNRSIDARSDAGRRILEDRRTKAIERQRDRAAGSRPTYSGPRRMTSDSWQRSSGFIKSEGSVLVRDSLDQEGESRRVMIIPSSSAILTSDMSKTHLTERRGTKVLPPPPRPAAFDRDPRQRPTSSIARPGARQEPRPAAAGGAGTASPQRPQLGRTIPDHIAPRPATVVPKPTPAPWAKNKK
jgi:hypothetical protein